MTYDLLSPEDQRKVRALSAERARNHQHDDSQKEDE